MDTLTNVIEFLIQHERKDLADIVIRELKRQSTVIEKHVYEKPLIPITPLPKTYIGDPLQPPYTITCISANDYKEVLA